MDHRELFESQKPILHEIKQGHTASFSPSQSVVDRFLNSDIDFDALRRIESAVDRRYDFALNVDVSDEEARQLLDTVQKGIDDERFADLIAACRNNVLVSIVGPFGLGALIAKHDKNGGNVATVHNVREGVDDARAQVRYRREDYTQAPNSEGKVFERGGDKSVGSEFTRSQLDRKGNLTDGYTGKIEKGKDTSPDHVVSVSEFHKEGGFVLSARKKADFGTDRDNLASTRRDINQSMRDHDKMEWMDKTSSGRSETNEEHFDIDRDLVQKQHKKGKEAAGKHAPKPMDKAKYYVPNIARTGIAEGAKMGIQQALGLVLCEFFQATFDEIDDIYRQGFKRGLTDATFLPILKDRLTRVSKRVAERWKDSCEAFKSGFVSGFLSNLVTVIVNTFVSTGKRVVRIIREGFFSLLKAVKLLCCPPENMTAAQAAHEASKLIAAGLMVVVGIALEDSIDKSVIVVAPILEPFADIITAVLVGALTAIATTFVVYAIDKIDLLKVNAEQRNEEISGTLAAQFDTLFAEADALIEEPSFAFDPQ